MNLYHRLWNPIIRRLAFGLYHFFGGYRVEGTENIPRRGPALVACNHISVADPLAVLAASPRVLHYMAARELHQARILGPVIRFLRAFPVTRGTFDPEAMALCRSLLQAGEAVTIFPEGGCSPDGRLGPLYPGIAALALRVGCPVVPVVLEGTNGMLPLGARFLRFHPKRIRFGPPLHLGRLQPGVPVRDQVDRALRRIRQALLDLGAPPGDEDYQGNGRRDQTRSTGAPGGEAGNGSGVPPPAGTR